jgi:O-antigen/teichoic acid export membrane protein
MALMMCINLYTSRIVLETLGVEDYGIFNVVGGVIVMFSFISDGMMASTQRFLTFELGKGDKDKLHAIFITSLHIHILLAIVTVIVGETIGLWFVLEKMVIPPERLVAALWCYHLSILTIVLTILYYPYMSAIVAHEKMSSFAYIAILDAILRLLMVYLLLVFDYDRLIFYAILYASEKILIRMVYNFYCIRHFEECKYKWIFQKSLFKEMGVFAGWSMGGHIAYAGYNQGLNLLLNLFFGPVVNAARAVSVQAQAAVSQFALNFQMAINPQITKTYASGQLEEMHQLIYRGTRLTFCLMLILCLPLIVETPMVLGIWLKVVPDGSVTFLRLLLVILIVQQCRSPLATSMAATGKVKKFELVVSGTMLTILPISYVVLRMGGKPWSVFAVYLAILVLSYFAFFSIVLPMIKLRLIDYIKHAVRPCVTVLFLSLMVPALLKLQTERSMLISFVTITLTVISTGFLCFKIGLDEELRNLIKSKIHNVLKLKTQAE